MTQKQVAKDLEWSISKIIRIETGAVPIAMTDLRALLHHYGVTDKSRVDELVEVAKSARAQAWWDDYLPLLHPKLINFVAVEASATIVRQFQTLLVPGLLQTEDYARGVALAYQTASDVTDRAVQLRMDRQGLLAEDSGVEAFFVLDEAAIRRRVGSSQVMRDQLEHLKTLSRRPGISIQVVTFDAGVHDGMQTPFTLFEFEGEGQDPVVYLDQPGQVLLGRNDPEEVSSYLEAFQELEDLASSGLEELGNVIDKVAADFVE